MCDYFPSMNATVVVRAGLTRLVPGSPVLAPAREDVAQRSKPSEAPESLGEKVHRDPSPAIAGRMLCFVYG